MRRSSWHGRRDEGVCAAAGRQCRATAAQVCRAGRQGGVPGWLPRSARAGGRVPSLVPRDCGQALQYIEAAEADQIKLSERTYAVAVLSCLKQARVQAVRLSLTLPGGRGGRARAADQAGPGAGPRGAGAWRALAGTAQWAQVKAVLDARMQLAIGNIEQALHFIELAVDTAPKQPLQAEVPPCRAATCSPVSDGTVHRRARARHARCTPHCSPARDWRQGRRVGVPAGPVATAAWHFCTQSHAATAGRHARRVAAGARARTGRARHC